MPIYTPGILWPRPIHTPSGQIVPHEKITISVVLSEIPKNYLILQQGTEDSVLPVKLSEKAKLTELKS